MISVPMLGWSVVSAARIEVPTHYLGLFRWPNLAVISDMSRSDKRLYGSVLAQLHKSLAYIMLLLAFSHAGAALYHHFAKRDNVLTRMLPPFVL